MTFTNQTILVTGATGFIGAHCVGQLLERKYSVRVAARSALKFAVLKEAVPSNLRNSLTLAIVSDITSTEELVEAVRGCSGVLHLASPYTYAVDNFEAELLDPALNGTVSILQAAHGEPMVKRVVITSSFAAVFDASKGLQPGVVLSETSFSPLTYEDGIKTKDPAVAYRASKIVAERAAWNYVEQKKPHFDIAMICPPMVFGPLYTPALLGDITNLNFSNQVIWGIVTSKSGEIPPTKGPVWVDVRDLARAHVEALVTPAARNQRYMVSAGDFDNQEVADILREKLNHPLREKVPVGEPGKRLSGTHFTTDSSKAIKDLGVTFRPLDLCVLDLVNQLIKYTECK